MKLSERSELAGFSQGTDTYHVVRGGQSYKRLLSNILDTAQLPYRSTLGTEEFIIFKKDPTATTTRVLAAGDFLIYIDTQSGSERMVIGMAIASVSSYPTDLEDNAKFLRFYDGSPLL